MGSGFAVAFSVGAAVPSSLTLSALTVSLPLMLPALTDESSEMLLSETLPSGPDVPCPSSESVTLLDIPSSSARRIISASDIGAADAPEKCSTSAVTARPIPKPLT